VYRGHGCQYCGATRSINQVRTVRAGPEYAVEAWARRSGGCARTQLHERLVGYGVRARCLQAAALSRSFTEPGRGRCTNLGQHALTLASPLLLGSPAAAQGNQAGVARFPLETDAVTLTGPARAGVYLGDEGRRAALLGDETGSFEVWVWPLKLVRNLELAIKVPEYDTPIPGSAVAREVIVRPAGATIVYAHASFTVRQHLFVPLDEPGALILLDVETVRPLDVLVQLRADFNLAWPGSFGGGYITWQPDQRRFLLSQGGVRHYNGFIGSPFAEGGTTHPAHDAPMIPSQFTLRFDTARTSVSTSRSWWPVASRAA
jgi:hypothetical protein